MVLSYAITVCNELTEIQNLVTFLLDNKRTEDEIIITYDSKNGSSRVEEYLRSHSVNNQFMWYPFEFNGNFSDLKNHTKSKCRCENVFTPLIISCTGLIHFISLSFLNTLA